MKSYKIPRGKQKADPSSGESEQPLLRSLIAECARRGDTFTSMANALGVTYTRVAQWRRGDAQIQNSRRPVFERAAKYLDWPVLYVLVQAEVIHLSDFSRQSTGTLNDRLSRAIVEMRQHPGFGAFVPQSLELASQDVKMFAVFLFGELKRSADDLQGVDWLTMMQENARAYLGDSKLR